MLHIQAAKRVGVEHLVGQLPSIITPNISYLFLITYPMSGFMIIPSLILSNQIFQVVPGSTLEDSKESILLCEQYPKVRQIYATTSVCLLRSMGCILNYYLGGDEEVGIPN